LSTKYHRREHLPSRGNASSSYHWNLHRVNHRRHQHHCRRLLPAIVTSRLEALSHHRIAAFILRLARKLAAAYKVNDRDPIFLQSLRPRLRIPCRSEYNLHPRIENHLNVLIYVGVQKRYVYSKWFGSSRLALEDVFS